MALGESLYPLLQFVEVALRNAVHREMSTKFKNPFWFEDPLLVDGRTLATARETRRTLAQEALRTGLASSDIPDGQMVAKATFGFWAAFFYAENFRAGSRLWSGHSLKRVFAHASAAQRDPGYLRKILERTRRLRNRVMHHEPIWNRPNLMRTRQEVYEMVGWIDPGVAELVDRIDRSPTIHAGGVASCMPLVEAIFP